MKPSSSSSVIPSSSFLTIMSMFKDASIFSIAAAEVTQVQGTVHRVNSPTEITFTNAPTFLPFGTFGPPFANIGRNPTGHPPIPPPQASDPSAPAQRPVGGSGMFAGAVNFSIQAAEVISVQSDYERRDSGTRVKMGPTPFNMPFHSAPFHQHAARDDTDDSEDDDRRSVNRGRHSRGRDYDGHPEPFYREDDRSRRSHQASSQGGSSSRSMPYPSPGSMGRRYSDSRYANNAERSRPPQNMQAETPRSRKKTKGKSGRDGKRWRGIEERSDEGQASHRSSQERSSQGYDAPEGMSSRRTN
ncbi:hypothetical protein C8R47DRAFT_1148620 [Mycena vitilis]|nr:hypothetical protein C8R47DRAFT_1148620 [Mycena vitilis]